MLSLCLLHFLKSKAETYMAVACGECRNASASDASLLIAWIVPCLKSQHWQVGRAAKVELFAAAAPEVLKTDRTELPTPRWSEF